ncbi:uncharacterized protein FOMMEDRAFT_161462 [Fomitiporia mediterranea MF3/22]|uniref:uncharacterized protein n=1 Tax=Fomitiporia mediterranea (strain MF3/22) TaxID=694068 RepID=UPI0004408AC9|nr:uncharacterized protein FOMMEDRAFT_161462 [Fomitiporia mediterranea MF3/22]EJC98635.1 hypothetical protein FOMMEDRAFT_161462 [Fomitiporia mediterranea MF3/22]
MSVAGYVLYVVPITSFRRLLNSQPCTDVADCSLKAENILHQPDSGLGSSEDDRGHGSGLEPSTRHPSELSPRKTDLHRVRNDNEGAFHRDSDAARVNSDYRPPDQIFADDTHEQTSNPGPSAADLHAIKVADSLLLSPQKVQKHSADEECRKEEGAILVDNTFNALATAGSRKKIRLSNNEGAFAAGSVVSSKSSRSDKTRDLMSSRVKAVGTKDRGRRLAANASDVVISATSDHGTKHIIELQTFDRPHTGHAGTEVSGPEKPLCGLTVPVAPTFTNDALCQQRTLAAAERQRGLHEKKDGGKSHLLKSDDRLPGNDTITRASMPGRPTHEPLKPTLPRPFRFETDFRQASRAEFEVKLRAWEQRASRSSSVHDQGKSRKSLPDFKGLHAAQEGALSNMAARRREHVAPTIPVSPNFIVDTRLAERRKFEEARREREKEADRVMEEQQRAKEIEEERKWREARKRTVPRANAVPKWYVEKPKRSTQSS